MRQCALNGCEIELLRPDDIYCSRKHGQRQNYLTRKAEGYWDKRYQAKKRAWKMSPNGKAAGIPIRVWLALPESWR